MWRAYAVALVAAFIVAVAALFVDSDRFAALVNREHVDVAWVFTEKLRGSLFSGFLTLGGFLLSLKTFILVKMKEGVYDNVQYREHVEQARKINQDPALSLYGPLVVLKQLLFWSIIAALSTATLQLTLGLWRNIVASTACLAAAAFTIGMLTQSLLLLNQNLNTWFEYMEKDYKEKLTKTAAAAAEQKPPPA